MSLLAPLLDGVGPVESVLQTCRLEGFGGELYGREEVCEALRYAALDSKAAESVVHPEFEALIGDDWAVCGDVFQGRLGRVWVLSGGAPTLPPRPRVDTPSEPDLAQARWSARFDPDDHPGMPAAAAAALAVALTQWPDSGLRRLRPLVIRASHLGGETLALVRIEGEEPVDVRRPLGCYGLLRLDGSAILHRLDTTGLEADRRRVWRPRL